MRTQMSDETLHVDNDTPKASDADIKRCDADTVVGRGDSKQQGIGFSPTDVREDGIQNAPKTIS
jgi:hypothetical protein